MMREVTPYWFTQILAPFAGLGDIDDSPLHEVDPADEAQVRTMLSTYVRPEFESLPDPHRFAVRLSLSYFLSAGHSPSVLERPLDGLLASELNTPNPKDFYIWLWEELFAGQAYVLPDVAHHRISKRGVLLYRGKPVFMPPCRA